MKSKLLLIIGLLLHFSWLLGQSEKSYFQQEVDYQMHFELNDEAHALSARETISYKNNSPDTLEFIFFHVWPNAYRSYNTAFGKQKLEEGSTLFYHAEDSIRGFIDSLDFSVNEQRLKWSFTRKNKDICKVFLSEPLKPGEQVKITTPFNVKIPKGIFSRLGHIGQSYQITQWYPKPAVYDKDGWHPMPYLDQGEFYSEFGSFDVYITLPKNYVVGATGDLVDGEEEVKWLTEIADKIAKIDSFDYMDIEFPPSSPTNKTLHYHQKNVHDFAWFADKRYHVLKGEVELPETKKKVTTWAMFTNINADVWKKSIEYLNDAIYYYSLWNMDYPYNQVTAVDGALSAGGGMEYPNVTVIGDVENDFSLETVIMHEVGHNWFYGILGSNERDHPWMDEGLNSMNENRYIETKYPTKKLIDNGHVPQQKILKWFDLEDYPHKSSYELLYLFNARMNKDQPIEENSTEYTTLNYGGIVYSKTAIAFDYLMAYLGEELYDQCMKRYFEEWKFKHPQPNDLRKIFEEETKKDLSWFFDDMIKTTKKIDYKIVGLKNKESGNSPLIKVKNKGGIHGPFSISGIKDNSIIETKWFGPIEDDTLVPFPQGDYDKYKIDAALDIPEINRKNNTLKTKGLCKKTEPLRFQWLGSIENPNKTQLFYTPIVGWNMNDKGMAGMAFYNSTILAKKFEYLIAPMYAFGSKNINGYASGYYHFMPNSIFQDIVVGIKSASFSYLRFDTDQNSAGREILEYYKVAPSIEFTFKKKRARQHSTFFVSLENVNLFEEKAVFNNGIYKVEVESRYVNRLISGVRNNHVINPYDLSLEFQQTDNFVKLNLTANYRFSYKKKGTGLDLRFFLGRFLYNSDVNQNSRYNYNLDGSQGSDYLYEHIFLARNTLRRHGGFLTQQLAVSDGGFKNLASAQSDGRGVNANRWLNSLNIKSNLFIKNLSVYGDFAFVGFLTKSFRGDEIDGVSDGAYNIGLALNVVPNIFEVYFPLFMSSDFNQLNYAEQIRFTLNIHMLNPLKQIRNLGL